MKTAKIFPLISRSFRLTKVLSVLILITVFCVTVFAQEINAEKSNFLLSVIFKLERLSDVAQNEIQFLDGEIRKADDNIRKSENIIRLARERGNTEAERIASGALASAQDAKAKNLAAKQALETKFLQIKQALGTVKNELAQSAGNPQKIESMVTSFKGRVSVQKAGEGKPFEIAGNNPVFLEKGDVIVTYGGSAVELQTLGGRGNLKLGEYTQIEIGKNEGDAEAESIKLVKGKIEADIEKLEAFEKALDEKIEAYENDLKTAKDELKQKIVSQYKATRKSILKYRKKFEIKTPCIAGATRSTRFSVEVDAVGNTVVAVTEGSFELNPLTGGEKVIVNAGEKIFVSKEGEISKPVKIEAGKGGR